MSRWIAGLTVATVIFAVFLWMNPPQPDFTQIDSPEPSSQFESAASSDYSGLSLSSVVDVAKQKIGNPYLFGGTGEGGFDCSGLFYASAKDLGYTIPRNVRGLLAASVQIDEETAKNTKGAFVFMRRQSDDARGRWKAGDLVHIAASTGDGQTVEAWVSKGVTLAPWGWWSRSYATYQSYFGRLKGAKQ